MLNQACFVGCRWAVVALVLFLTPVVAAQTTWFVDDDTCAAGAVGSGTFGDPFCSIQIAIDAALNGDEIVVALGTYNEAINLSGKAILLRSTDPIDPAVVAATILDGTGIVGSIITCDSGEGPGTVIDGLTISNGSAVINGGGMININGSSPTVANCTFSLNSADFGGGMYNLNTSSPTVIDCTFSGNMAIDGGGMYSELTSSPTVTDCTFSGNTASTFGGGM